MPFDILPPRSDSAATNMATDFLLLQHYPAPAHARFRHYGWTRPAVTFGYSQPVAWVRAQLGADGAALELCRRPSGGGVVDHRDDWTYALVIPPRHPLSDARAITSYEAVHRTLAGCLQALGCAATVKEACAPEAETTAAGPAGVCFQRAECFDVVHATTGAKLAGAAQKRAKRGLLFQGSIARAAVGDLDWAAWAESFPAALAALLNLAPSSAAWPEGWDEAVDALADSYSSPEWNERR